MSGDIKPKAHRLTVASDAEYHARGEVSRTQIEDYIRDPYMFFQRHVLKAGEFKATPSMVLGTAIHERVLLGDFQTVRPIDPEVAALTGKGSRTALAEWKDANPADAYLSQDDAMTVERVCLSIQEHPAAHRLLTHPAGENEIPVAGFCPATSQAIRCKFDRIIEQEDRVVVVDLKTTTDASPRKFAWKCYDFGYHRQAAWYSELATQLTGKPATFYIIAVETNSFARCEVYELSEGDIQSAYGELFANGGAMRRLYESRRADYWRPAHYGRVHTLTLPTPQAYEIDA